MGEVLKIKHVEAPRWVHEDVSWHLHCLWRQRPANVSCTWFDCFLINLILVSLCNINAFSVREVMRIKDMITQHELRW